MSIQNDNWVSFNLNELVSIRASFLEEELDEDAVDEVASYLRRCLTWDTMYGMIDNAILDHFDKLETHYGEIQTGVIKEPEFEMVDLVAPAWTIKVPRRIK